MRDELMIGLIGGDAGIKQGFYGGSEGRLVAASRAGISLVYVHIHVFNCVSFVWVFLPKKLSCKYFVYFPIPRECFFVCLNVNVYR